MSVEFTGSTVVTALNSFSQMTILFVVCCLVASVRWKPTSHSYDISHSQRAFPSSNQLFYNNNKKFQQILADFCGCFESIH